MPCIILVFFTIITSEKKTENEIVVQMCLILFYIVGDGMVINKYTSKRYVFICRLPPFFKNLIYPYNLSLKTRNFIDCNVDEKY